jgi:hypothetical protein
LNESTPDAPVKIYNGDNRVTLHDPQSGRLLYSYDLTLLPAPGSEATWLATYYITRDGVQVFANLYQLPNGNLQLQVGGASMYTFTWTPIIDSGE